MNSQRPNLELDFSPPFHPTFPPSPPRQERSRRSIRTVTKRLRSVNTPTYSKENIWILFSSKLRRLIRIFVGLVGGVCCYKFRSMSLHHQDVSYFARNRESKINSAKRIHERRNPEIIQSNFTPTSQSMSTLDLRRITGSYDSSSTMSFESVSNDVLHFLATIIQTHQAIVRDWKEGTYSTFPNNSLTSTPKFSTTLPGSAARFPSPPSTNSSPVISSRMTNVDRAAGT